MGNNQEAIERMRRGYEAFSKADLDALRELFSPEIVWHSGGDNPLTGDYKGIDEVFGLFGRIFEMTEGTVSQEVHDLLASDDHGVAISRFSATRPDGRNVDMNQVSVFHLDDQLRVTEAWVVPQDQAEANAFFS